MPVELSQVLSICSVVIAFLALYRNTKADTKNDAGQLMEVIVKLETISENVKEIKLDIKDVKADMEKVKERLVKVEQSTKSAHHRLDTIEGKTYEETDRD